MKRDLHDDLRPHPVRAQARQALGLRERRLRDLERVEPRAQVEQQRRVEAGADLPGEARSRPVEVADEQRAEADARALRIGEAADDEAPASPRTSSSASASSGGARTGESRRLAMTPSQPFRARALPGLRVVERHDAARAAVAAAAPPAARDARRAAAP